MLDDEFFYVVEGQLLIDLEDRTVSGSILVKASSFPRKVVHRTRAPRRTVVLIVENKGILPTGDSLRGITSQGKIQIP